MMAKTTKGFTKITMSAQADSADVYIYEQIGEGWFGGLGAKAFVDQLNALGPVATLNVKINSPGGDVFEGNAIYNALKAHQAKVVVSIDSLAASAASMIAMAGDEITIAPTAMVMIHNARGIAAGEASDHRALADVLDKVSAQMGVAYARSGKSADEIAAIMDAETWYTAQEAVDAGFCDSIIADSKSVHASVTFSPTAFAGFKNTPKALLSEAKTPETEPISAETGENKPDFTFRNKYRAESLRLAEL